MTGATNERAAYETFDVAVSAGALHTARWGHGAPLVVALHGLTASHAEFHALADQLGSEALTLVAPDLRGRGGSSDVGGPYGIDVHADDVIAVLDHLGAKTATLLGHSMGAFVSVVAAHRHPERVERVVLVDGGLPLRRGILASSAATRAIRQLLRVLPARTRRRGVERILKRLTGSSLDRLDAAFTSEEDYLRFWKGHPALRDNWNPYVEKAFLYELVGEAPRLRSGVRKDAVLADSEHSLLRDDVERAITALSCPAVVVRAAEGFRGGDPGVYSDADIAGWKARLPHIRDVFVEGTNHYTILLTELGAKAVAAVVQEETAA